MSDLEVVKLIHYGKYNDVFVAEDSEGKQYALKRFYKQELQNRKDYTNKNGKLIRNDWISDFKRSLEIQLKVKDDSCVRSLGVYGVTYDDNNEPTFDEEIELVLELAECGSLMRLEVFDEPIPLFPRGVVKCVAKDILSAIKYLESINVAHRDVKPDNIFMNRTGRSKLGDFGESEFMNDGKVTGTRGSYYFLAPEALSLESTGIIGEYDGIALDMWALGITLWIIYFGRFPFKTATSVVIQLFIEIRSFDIDKEVDYLKTQGVETDDRFLDFIKRILDNDPTKRIRPNEALVHEWLQDTDYSCAENFALSQIVRVI